MGSSTRRRRRPQHAAQRLSLALEDLALLSSSSRLLDGARWSGHAVSWLCRPRAWLTSDAPVTRSCSCRSLRERSFRLLCARRRLSQRYLSLIGARRGHCESSSATRSGAAQAVLAAHARDSCSSSSKHRHTGKRTGIRSWQELFWLLLRCGLAAQPERAQCCPRP